MQKEFDRWNNKKELIELREKTRLFFHEREVWWCSLGLNVGFEQDGNGEQYARPGLVFKKFNNEVFWALPLSTRIKKGKFYSPIFLDSKIARVVILSQLRLIDAKRLIDKIGVIDDQNYQAIQKALITICSS